MKIKLWVSETRAQHKNTTKSLRKKQRLVYGCGEIFCLRQGNRKFLFFLRRHRRRCAQQINVIEQCFVVVSAINFVNSRMKKKDQLQTSGAGRIFFLVYDRAILLCSTFRCCGLQSSRVSNSLTS